VDTVISDLDHVRQCEERQALGQNVVQALILEGRPFTPEARRLAIGERLHEALNLRYAAQLREQLAARRARKARAVAA
jgi:hypothetical protein